MKVGATYFWATAKAKREVYFDWEAKASSSAARCVGSARAVCKSGLCRLRGSFERVLAGDILGVSRLGWVQQVDAQLLFAAGATLKIERLGLVELTHNAGKHAMEGDFCHVLVVEVDG